MNSLFWSCHSCRLRVSSLEGGASRCRSPITVRPIFRRKNISFRQCRKRSDMENWLAGDILNGGIPTTGSKGAVPWNACYTHDIDLQKSEEDLFCSLKSSNQRNIHKARREGVEIRISDSEDSLRVFFRLHCLTRKRHGVPPQPSTFFKNLYLFVMAKGYGIVVSAWYRHKIIAVDIFVKNKEIIKNINCRKTKRLDDKALCLKKTLFGLKILLRYQCVLYYIFSCKK